MAEHYEGQEKGGLALPSLIIGLLAGAAIYVIGEHWIEPSEDKALAITSLLFVGAFAASWLLLAERDDIIRPAGFALAITAILAGPNFYMASATDNYDNLAEFPSIFWFLLAGPLSAYLMITLAKAILKTGSPPNYAAIFFHGLTLPLITGGAKIFAGLALLLLFAWAKLLESMGVDFFEEVFRKGWFIWPFLGAVGGISIAMMRGQQSVLGALRYILLLFSRIIMPIMAVFSVTFLIALVAQGPGVILEKDLAGDFIFGQISAVILFLSFFAMLVFNGVYQNGEGAPPPAWLRMATNIAIATFPIYIGLAGYAMLVRVEEYGLTPPRIGGLAITGLAFLYSLVCIAGLLTELNWRGKRWMPLVGSLNTFMAALWVIVLIGISSPIINTWAMSAKSQEKMLVEGKIAAEKFDYGYLKFKLGRHGEKALDRLYNLTTHAEAQAIREGVDKARNALQVTGATGTVKLKRRRCPKTCRLTHRHKGQWNWS